jgi:phosphatidate cytidylyltransferase
MTRTLRRGNQLFSVAAVVWAYAYVNWNSNPYKLLRTAEALAPPISYRRTVSPLGYTYRTDASRRIQFFPLTATRSTGSAVDTVKNGDQDSSISVPTGKRFVARQLASLPQRAVRIYSEYVSRLWRETNPEARQIISQDKAATAIRRVQHLIRGEQLAGVVSWEEKNGLALACDHVLEAIEQAHRETARNISAPVTNGMDMSIESKPTSKTAPPPTLQKKSRSVLFGAIMGAVVACWVFSGNYIFTGLFTLMTLLGQLEYYRMVMGTGVNPARRISVLGSCSMFLTALFTPSLHEICLPIFGLYAMIWFLTMKRTVTTIPEIATTFTGMFYLGYVPSFWVRIRILGTQEPTRLASVAEPFLRFLADKSQAKLVPSFIPQAVVLPITTGSIFIFWTWLCLAFSDVGAYFVGRRYGNTKLGAVAPAAGATSPNKTVEGVLGGCAVSGLLGVFGAWAQKWPYWGVTGAVHGILLGLIGLIGDLTASMIKRDAGVKDFGDLIPDHGGILDRVDSFIWSAPYSWLVINTVIPFLKSVA